jgi:hypothetical protein
VRRGKRLVGVLLAVAAEAEASLLLNVSQNVNKFSMFIFVKSWNKLSKVCCMRLIEPIFVSKIFIL